MNRYKTLLTILGHTLYLEKDIKRSRDEIEILEDNENKDLIKKNIKKNNQKPKKNIMKK